jgi:hypothetical protein
MLPKSSEFRIWALDVTKDPRNTVKEFIFIDRNGVPYNANNADIRIIRSGRRNMMDASVGSITSMKNPILLDANNNYDKVVINNATDVVNSGAMEYKEKWKVQDAFWVKKRTRQVTRYAPVGPPMIFTPVHSYSYLHGRRHGLGDDYDIFENHNDDKAFAARKSDLRYNKTATKFLKYEQQSWLLFNFDAIGNAKIKRAYLSLFSHSDFPISPALHKFDTYLNNGSYPAHEIGNSHSNRPYNANLSGHTDNTFRLSRMKTSSWPSDWESQFQNTPLNIAQDRIDVVGPSQYNSTNLNYSGQPGTIGGKIDVSEILNAMIKDKYEKQYITGFNMRLLFNPGRLPYNSRDQETRVCFNNYFDLGNNGDMLKPKIELAYYDCGNALPENSPLENGVEYGECVTTETETICHSVFDKDYINPYVRGLLGDWRPLKSYVYYGERREQDPASVTNISKDGIIKDFETFWNLDPVNKQITKTGSAKWTWNSEITQYNRKGAELENKDPLQRYNASIYGYNEALPVAVVNNSKLRQSAYDGFEDYFFKDQSCIIDCNPNKRHFNINPNIYQLDENQSHTGKYSLRTDYNTVNTSTTSIKIPISADNNAADANTPDLRIGITKTVTNVPTVNLQGTGLMGMYQHDPNTAFKLDPVINFSYGHNGSGDWSIPPNSMPYPIEHKGGNRITWTGRILVDQSGTYSFSSIGTPDDNEKIYINGSPVFDQVPITTVDLQAGTAYPVTILFTDRFHGGIFPRNTAHYDFSWRLACATTNYQLVPAKNMYPTKEAADASVHYNNPYTCTNVSTIRPLANYLIDGFNLIYDKKMVAGVWVKKGKEDCRCPQYDGVSIKLRTSAGATIGTAFTAKSPIIEGWQLFETEFDVPSSGSEIELFVDNSAGDQNVYIDDLRFHPYNSNMKCFVYNPYNLKPAAELDENNYATFYEYDDDGTLIRVKKETKLGVKTIQETRSSLQKKVTAL